MSRYAIQAGHREFERACVSCLVLVDDVGDAEEDSPGGHDERADHGVHEADHQD